MQNVLITGGAGFIGSHLVESLSEMKVNITVLDDFSNGSNKNLKEYEDKIKIIKFDVSNDDWSSLDKYDVDTIFHLATHPRSFSLQDPIRNTEVNVIGTLKVLDYAKKKKASTSTTGSIEALVQKLLDAGGSLEIKVKTPDALLEAQAREEIDVTPDR